MTDAAATLVPEPQEHAPARETLWVTDAELIRRLGVPEKVAREAIRALDQNRASGFPPKQKFWGDRRYWPAVRAYLDVNFGLKVVSSTSKRGQYDR